MDDPSPHDQDADPGSDGGTPGPTGDGDIPDPTGDGDIPDPTGDGDLFDREAATEPAATSGEAPDETVVPKRTFCERCRWFSDPPEVRCTHEGTEIVEMVDRDHFRVSNCPVVEEREELAETTRPAEFDPTDG